MEYPWAKRFMRPGVLVPGLVPFGLVAVAVLAVIIWLLSALPLPQDRIVKVKTGMSPQQVTHILGRPDRVYHRGPAHATLDAFIGTNPGEGLPASPRVHQDAVEVRRWDRLLDQEVGVVFDGERRVIYVWEDD